MPIYIAYCEDRHTDPVIAAFSTAAAAIAYAREFMQENMAHPENIEEEEVEGYLLFLGYGEEADKAYVVEVELDKPE